MPEMPETPETARNPGGARLPHAAPRPREALIGEAAEWIADQIAEEGIMINSGFVDLILSMEWDAIDAGAEPTARAAIVQTIVARMDAEGVRVGPPPETLSTDGMAPDVRKVPPEIVERVISWEDDFLALAGRARTI